MQSLQTIKTQLKKSLTKDEKIKLETYMQSLGFSRKNQEDLDKCLSIEAEKSVNDEYGQLLIRAGANVNAYQGVRGSCLHIAAKEGSPAMVALLLAGGAKPNALNGRGSTPLDSAMPMNTPSLSSIPGLKEKVTLLLNNGADVNIFTPSPIYKTLLHLAVLYSKCDELAMLIINNGLNLKYNSEEGTYLHFACEYASEKVVQLLLDKGADINSQAGRYFAVPFYYAMDNKKLRDIFLLKLIPPQTSTNPSSNALFNNKCLQKACDTKRRVLIQFFLDIGADPKSVKEKNSNPLDSDVKRILAQNMSADYLSEITSKMVLFLVNNFYHEQKDKILTLENITQLRSYIIAALDVPLFVKKLGVSNISYVKYFRAEIVKDMQNAILGCFQTNKFSMVELTASIGKVVKIWEGNNSTNEKTQKITMEEQSPRDVSMHTSPRATSALSQSNEEIAAAPTLAYTPEKIYSSAAAQQTFYPPTMPPRPSYPPPSPPQDVNICADDKNRDANRVNDAAKDSAKDDHEMDIEVSASKKKFGNSAQ